MSVVGSTRTYNLSGRGASDIGGSSMDLMSDSGVMGRFMIGEGRDKSSDWALVGIRVAKNGTGVA